jgi:hypothetical protein
MLRVSHVYNALFKVGSGVLLPEKTCSETNTLFEYCTMVKPHILYITGKVIKGAA